MKTFSKSPARGESSRLIACPICGGERFSPRWTARENAWVRCRGCSLLLQNPQPLAEGILERYDREYFAYERANEGPFLQLMELGLRDVGFEELLPREPADRSFLDVGCATGCLIASLGEKGWRAEGVEVCRASADYGRESRGVSIFGGTLEEAAFPEGSFSFVHNSHVIEHINRPDLFVREIFRILKPGGYYICATPNCRGLQALLFREQWRSAIPDHLFLFSTKTLPRLAEKEGFRVLRRKTWGGLGRGTAPGWLKHIADRAVKPLNWGDVMIYLFQKPPAA